MARAEGLKVRPIWLTVSANERYLLLEDTDTGDVLLPLIYMKTMFEANYSRKLSSLQHRLVTLPKSHMGDRSRGFVYWQWAFESPHEVKVLVRKMLGEENTPQGHLRLILLPIVFNAMAQKAKLRQSPFFLELEAAIKASSYWPLLKASPADGEMDSRCPPAGSDQASGQKSASTVDDGESQVSTLAGARSGRAGGSQEQTAGIVAHTFLNPKVENFGEESGREGWNERRGLPHLHPGRPACSSNFSSNELSRPAFPAPPGAKFLFHGPYDIERTMAKYCLSYEAAEADDSRKGNKMAERVVRVTPERELSVVPGLDLGLLKQQGDQIQADLKDLRRECQEHMASVAGQLQALKECMTSMITQVAAVSDGLASVQRGLLPSSNNRGPSDTLNLAPNLNGGYHQSSSQLLHADLYQCRQEAEVALQPGPARRSQASTHEHRGSPSWLIGPGPLAGGVHVPQVTPWNDAALRPLEVETRTKQLMPEGPVGGSRQRQAAEANNNEGTPYGKAPVWTSYNVAQASARSQALAQADEDKRGSTPWPGKADLLYPRLSL